jgi:hypothetical protein
MTFGQLTGTKTIPGDYATIEAAVAALNAQGVGAGGVTFNVAAGHSETFSAPNAGLITATGTAANQIIFQKSGAGVNPVITAAVLASATTTDGVIKIEGGDYITFDGVDIQENAANTTNLTDWAYAILKSSGTNGSQNVTIRNCNISLNKTNTSSYGIYSHNHNATSTTTFTVTDLAGTNSFNKIDNVSLSNVYGGIYMYGFASAAPYAYYDQGNEIGVIAGNAWTDFGGGNSTSYGFYGIYQNGLKIANNSFTGPIGTNTSTGALYCIYLSTGVNSNLDIYSNTISITYNGTGTFYGMYSLMAASGTSNVTNINNNSVIGCSMPNATSGAFYGIYTYGGMTASWHHNNVINNSLGSGVSTATGSFYALYTYASPSSPGTAEVYNNVISNNSRNQSVLGSGFGYWFYQSGGNGTMNIYNNIVNNNTIASNSTQYIGYCLYSGTKYYYDNVISNVINANATVYGLYNGNGVAGYFYRNKIFNINSNATASIVYGIYQSSGTATYYYNNFISDLKAPQATGAISVAGAYLLGGTSLGFYNNTIFLNAVSTGSSFGTAGIYASTTPNVDLRNNIVVNLSTPGATGYTVGLRYTGTSLTNFAATSNFNDYFAGTPGSNNLIFYDGTNMDQTLAAFKARVSPRESSSVSENPPFMNVAAAPYDLHIQGGIATQLESGGVVVSSPIGITDDYDSDPRYPNAGYPNNVASPASAPDIGADEFAGIALDATPPNISLTPLGNTSSTGSRVLITDITDATGVPTAGIGLPVLYWKINAGSYTPAQATFLGGNQYSFTFGAGVGLNDVVSYYIVAQDLVTPIPNIGVVPSGGADGLNFNPPLCSTPPTTPFSYIIVGTLAGTYPVGVGQTYPTLTAAIADLNLKEVIAPVTFELWDANYSTSETFPLIIYPYAGMDVTRPVTFKPKAGVTATVTGAPATGILVLFGVDYIILDGSNSGGNDKSLTWENTSTSANSYTIGVFNNSGDPASNCTIKNCIIKASSQVTTNTFAIILNAAGGGYDNIVIDNNSIFSARYGIQFAGVSTAFTTNGKITNNIIGSAVNATAVQYRGITLSYADNTLISGNEIMGAPNGNTNTYQTGIYIMAGSTNTTISNNTIHDFYYTGTSGYGCYGIYYGSDATTPTSIYNNLIYNIKSDGDPGSQNYSPTGIYVFSGGNMKIYHNNIYMTGATLSASYTLSYSSCISIYSGITALDIRNNILKNSMTTASGSGSNKTYGIYSASANSVFTNIDYNDYFVDGLNPSIGFLGAAQATLADWKIATAQDLNSQNIDPVFVSSTDLHPTNTALDNLGLYLTEVTKDFDGISRTNPPDMGAYEFGVNPAIVTLAASGITCEEAILNGTINASGLTVNSFFDYGLTNAYGSSVAGSPAVVTGASPVAITATLSGLAGNTTYHFRARGLTGAGVMVYGDNFTFTTNASGAPTVVTTMATGIGDTWVTLNGTVNPNCDIVNAYFEYGTTVAYGSTVATTPNNFGGGVVTLVSAYQGSLLVGQTYHYRLVATNTYGTTYGADMTFTTGANPPVVVTNPATNIGNFTARLNGTVSANNQNTTVTFEYGLTTSYGSIASGVPGLVTGNTPTAVYADISGLAYNTTYHFRCVGQNPAGTTYGADQVFTTLCPVPEAAGAISGPTSVCQATSGHVYTVPPINFAYAGYVWTVPTGGTITSGANTNSITVSYNSSAVSGNVTVYGTSVCGNGTPSSLPVTVNPLPVPTITGPDLACITLSYVYTTEVGMSDYVWTVSAGGQIMSGAGTNTVSIKWNNTGAQSVSVNYTSAAGCPAAAPTTMNVSVGNLPTPTIVGSNLLCIGSGLHVYTTEGGFSDYVWTVSTGGTIVSGQGTYQIEVNYTTPGSKTVTVNYDNSYGCSAVTPTSFAVTVLALPGNAGAISGTPELCAGTQSVSYSVAAIPGALDYIWTLPSGATIVAGENTNSIQVDFTLDAASGDITVYAENLCGAGQPSPAYAVTVNPIPETPVVTIDEFFVLTSSAAIGNQWYFNGDMIDGANGQFYQAEEEGLYWTIVTINDCASEPSNQIEVIFTGLDELNGTGFSIYPIPNDGKFTATIVTSGEKVFTLYVFNNLGIKVYEMRDIHVNGKAQQNIELANPTMGIYTIVLQGNNHSVIRKVLVTK